jgi:hypothetical protein
MKGFTLLALLFAIGTFPAFADINNLVNNGGFEESTIALTNYYLTVNSGQSTITDWSVTGRSVDIVSTAFPSVNSDNWAHSGVQGIDLAGTPGPGGVEQSILTTAGVYYTFSFWASSNGGAIANGLQVGWNGETLAPTGISTPAQGTWEPFSYTVQATGSSTLISLSTPISGDAGPLVDDVNVHVPEPTSILLLGMMLGVAGLLKKRLA